MKKETSDASIRSSMTATPNDFKIIHSELGDELNQRILPFWMNQMRDHEHGGFYGQYLNDGTVVKTAAKGAVLNARILWTFSAAYQATGRDEYLHQAKLAYEYFIRHFIDSTHGGVYWSVDYRGKALNTRKQIYAQAFAVYALSEYFKASQDTTAIMAAIDLYNLIELHAFDREFNGYTEAFGRSWETLADLRLSTKDANEPKSMNTHLHVLEAYTNLYEVWKDLELESRLVNLVRIHFDHILHGPSQHFNLFFNMEWEAQSSAYSYGHDIEGAWLIRRAALVLDRKSLIEEANTRACAMAKVTLNEGIAKDGSLLNEGHSGCVTDTNRHWWPQAEAFVGFLDAFEICRDEMYYDAAKDVWGFIKERLRHPSGEWWWQVDAQYQPDMQADLAGEWKCPYHNARMCLEGIRRTAISLQHITTASEMQKS